MLNKIALNVIRFQLETKVFNTVVLLLLQYYITYILVFIKNNYNRIKCFDLKLLFQAILNEYCL